MEAKYFFAGIIILIFLFSNMVLEGSIYSAEQQEKLRTETMVIDGVGKNYSVGSEQNLVLIVTGANNRVTVEKGTNITQISLGGTGNVVLIPLGQKPKIITGGAQNAVFRYG